MGLKSRRTRDWPVIEGEPTEPYELPDDPASNAAHLTNIAEARTRRREQERTVLDRGIKAVSDSFERRHGRLVFRRLLLRRWTVELRRTDEDGREYKLQVWPDIEHAPWMLAVNLWRRRGH